jgi:hypothetical protein
MYNSAPVTCRLTIFDPNFVNVYNVCAGTQLLYHARSLCKIYVRMIHPATTCLKPSFFTVLRPILGCSSVQATVVVPLHLLTSLGVLVGGGCQSIVLS